MPEEKPAMDTQSIVMIVTTAVALAASIVGGLIHRQANRMQREIDRTQEEVRLLEKTTATKEDLRAMETRFGSYVHDVEARTTEGFRRLETQLNQLISLHTSSIVPRAPRRHTDPPTLDHTEVEG